MSPRNFEYCKLVDNSNFFDDVTRTDIQKNDRLIPGGIPSFRRTLHCIAACLLLFAGAIATGVLSYLHQLQAPKMWDLGITSRPEYANEPLAKKTIRYFDGYLLERAGIDGPSDFQANVNRALAPEIEFESVSWGPRGSSLITRGRGTWTQSGEERRFRKAFGSTELFTQMMFFGDNFTGTTTSYGTLFWGGELFGIPAPNKWIELRVCDFYRVKPDPAGIYGQLITYNLMMIDWADVVHRAGYPVLPPASLKDGVVLPPAANDGVPAPFSILAQNRDADTSRRVAESILREDWLGDANRSQLWHSDLTFYGPRGVGLARGLQEFRDHVLKPFHSAFVNRELLTEVLTCEGNYVAAMGHIKGDHVASWIGLPPSHKRLKVRFGMHWRIVDGKAQEGWAIFDVPGLYNQLGLNFFNIATRAASLV